MSKSRLLMLNVRLVGAAHRKCAGLSKCSTGRRATIADMSLRADIAQAAGCRRIAGPGEPRFWTTLIWQVLGPVGPHPCDGHVVISPGYD
jgi:hypothetical protein